jgi:hypothetical protein
MLLSDPTTKKAASAKAETWRQAAVAKAHPHWVAAQRQFERTFGKEAALELRSVLKDEQAYGATTGGDRRVSAW